MTPARLVDQTRFHDPPNSRGNCTEAALATLLGVPLEDIGDFPHGDAKEFWDAFNAAAERYGFDLVRFDCDMVFPGLYLASGPTIRGKVGHMVVKRDLELFHDPHPSRAGLTKVETTWIAVPFDPGAR